MYSFSANSQSFNLNDSLKNNQSISHSQVKKFVLGSVQGGLWLGSFISLNNTWYANYPRTKFHLYNDWKEWEHMDKAGHLWTAYQIAKNSSDLWKWAGTSDAKSETIGFMSALAYQGIIETLDGFSSKWGFSVPDMLANTSGALAYFTQQKIWKDQRIIFKLSYYPHSYENLKDRANSLFGNTIAERILKDYNSQTYWISINAKSFLKVSKLPDWLNISLGYGAETMLGGYNNSWVDPLNNLVLRTDIPRYRKYLISLDMDLSRIKTKNKSLKTLFNLVNVLKIPAPAIEITSNGIARFHPIYF